MLSYYDLRAMTLSLIMGISIVAATLLCHWAYRAQPASPTSGSRAEPSYPPDDLVGSELLPSFDGAEILPVDMPQQR